MIAASIISINFNIFQLSLFRMLIVLVFTLMLIQILMKNTAINFPRNQLNNFSIKVMVIWLLYAIFTLAFIKDDIGWYKAVYFLALGVLCVVIFSRYLKDSKSILAAFNLITVMALFHNLIGWYEVLFGEYLFLDEKVDLYAMFRYPVSMFDNANNFALFMLVSIFSTYICFVNSKHRLVKIGCALLILSSTYLLIKTNSRANILGLLLAIGFFILMQMKNKRARRLLLIGIVAAFVFALLKPDTIIHVFDSIYNKLYLKLSGDNSSDSDTIRINLIKNGLAFFERTFGVGVGAGNIEYWMENFRVYDTSYIRNMHNWWMEVLTGYGVVIFTLYIIYYIRLAKTMLYSYRIAEDKLNASISLGIMCFMIGFVLGSISSSSNIGTEWLWVFWGVIIAYQGTIRRPERVPEAQKCLT